MGNIKLVELGKILNGFGQASNDNSKEILSGISDKVGISDMMDTTLQIRYKK
jgi:hypothetical protein